MKFLKALLLIVLLLIGVYAILCAVGPSSMDTEKSTVINASSAAVYQEIADFKNWEKWSPWSDVDSTMVTTYSGTDSGTGAIMSWTSAASGAGRMEITSTEINSSVNSSLAFMDQDGNSMGEGTTNWTLEETAEGTVVTWNMNGFDMPFFFRGLFAFMGNPVEKDYERGLANLKALVESAPSWSPTFTDLPDMWVIGAERDSLTLTDLSEGMVHAEAYQSIGQFMGVNGIEMAGMPVCISRRYSEENMDLTFAIPVADSVAVDAGFVLNKIPGGKCVVGIHMGPYENLTDTWNKMEDWMKTNPQQIRFYPFEIYVNDPSTVSPEEIETHIVYPVEG